MRHSLHKENDCFFGSVNKLMLYLLFFFVCFPSKLRVFTEGKKLILNLLREGKFCGGQGEWGVEEWQQHSLVVKSLDAEPR